MHMQTTLADSAASITPAILKRLGSKRALLGVLALALIGAGLAWQWSWLAAIGVAPLLISAAPCVAMCALGLCMHRMCNHSGSTESNGTSQNSSPQQEI
jgi:hypothetical protein